MKNQRYSDFITKYINIFEIMILYIFYIEKIWKIKDIPILLRNI